MYMPASTMTARTVDHWHQTPPPFVDCNSLTRQRQRQHASTRQHAHPTPTQTRMVRFPPDATHAAGECERPRPANHCRCRKSIACRLGRIAQAHAWLARIMLSPSEFFYPFSLSFFFACLCSADLPNMRCETESQAQLCKQDWAGV